MYKFVLNTDDEMYRCLLTLQAVQAMMCNLLVSHIELRTEESIDIRPYTHERKIEKVVVPLGEELEKIKEEYIHVSYLGYFCL